MSLMSPALAGRFFTTSATWPPLDERMEGRRTGQWGNQGASTGAPGTPPQPTSASRRGWTRPGPPPAASAPPLVSWGKLPEQAKKEKLKIHVSCVCIIPRKEEREVQKGERLSPLHSGLGGPGHPLSSERRDSQKWSWKAGPPTFPSRHPCGQKGGSLHSYKIHVLLSTSKGLEETTQLLVEAPGLGSGTEGAEDGFHFSVYTLPQKCGGIMGEQSTLSLTSFCIFQVKKQRGR